MPGGFRQSPLKVNAGLAEVEIWNEDAIKARATRLADEAAKVWRARDLPADVLKAYQPSAVRSSFYCVFFKLAYLAPEVLKRLSCGREPSAVSLYDLYLLSVEAWGEQVEHAVGDASAGTA